MCNFWISSIVPVARVKGARLSRGTLTRRVSPQGAARHGDAPMMSALLEATARESGKEEELKEHMCVTSRKLTLLYSSLRLEL